MSEHETDEHDRGLSHDLPTLLDRRTALGLFGGAGLVAALAACTSSDGSLTGATSRAAAPSTSASATVDAVSGAAVTTPQDGSGGGEIPEETNGPFPADGSNGLNVLTASGIVRSDIRASFGSSTTVAQGVPLTVELTVVDVSGAKDAGTAVKGAAVYVWHCDREGRYSMYDSAISNENYLRGVQVTDRRGTVRFTTIYPAAYPGRWPHIHFEVYPTLADATSARNRLRTSQLAFPAATCDQVYSTDGYESSVQNMQRTSLDSDMVFSDGYALQLATMTGSVTKGLTARLRIPV